MPNHWLAMGKNNKGKPDTALYHRTVASQWLVAGEDSAKASVREAGPRQCQREEAIPHTQRSRTNRNFWYDSVFIFSLLSLLLFLSRACFSLALPSLLFLSISGTLFPYQYLHLYLSIHIYISLSISLSIHPSINPSIHPSIYFHSYSLSLPLWKNCGSYITRRRNNLRGQNVIGKKVGHLWTNFVLTIFNNVRGKQVESTWADNHLFTSGAVKRKKKKREKRAVEVLNPWIMSCLIFRPDYNSSAW